MSRVGGGRTHASSVGDCDVARAKGTEKFIQKGVKRHRPSQTVNVKYFFVYLPETTSHGSGKMHLFLIYFYYLIIIILISSYQFE